MNTSQQNLTANEVAKRLKKGRTTILRWCDDGIFPNAYKDGPYKQSPWAIPASDVEDYLKARGRR